MNTLEQQKDLFFKVLREAIQQESSVCISNSDLKYQHNIHIFDKLYITTLHRNIQNKEITFISIKDIDIKKEYRTQNIFSNIVSEIEALNVNVMVDDIINHRLFSFLYKLGYKPLKYNQYGGWIRSMYKLKGSQ